MNNIGVCLLINETLTKLLWQLISKLFSQVTSQGAS